MSGSKKKRNENTYDISSIKRATKKFLDVSRCSRAKQPQRNVQKKCAARAKLLVLLIRPIVVIRHGRVFTVRDTKIGILRRCLRCLALHEFIFCLNKL